MSNVRVAIAGATGYAGEELIRLLLTHPRVQLTCLAASAKRERPVPVSELYPRFARQLDLAIESLDVDRLARSCDVALLVLPHGMSMDLVPALLKAGRIVIDLAGDFRLKDPAIFERWYGKAHTQPALLQEAAYGLPELEARTIREARLIANPGCYATAAILACAPLLRARLVERDGIVIDAKSGLTGAGRKAEPDFLFAEMNENLWAYKVNAHQHAPEIEQALAACGSDGAVSLCFVPHVVPLNRGIFSTIYLRLSRDVTRQQVEEAYRDGYRQAPFVRLRPEHQWPRIRDVEGTNYCDLAFLVDGPRRRLIVTAVIDNLVKGAAGQAVQNLNLRMGWPETTGLLA